MRPAWVGIVGWVLVLAAFVLALVFVPYPINGTALASLAIGAGGAALVAVQVRRSGR